jgi:hypothetical protein
MSLILALGFCGSCFCSRALYRCRRRQVARRKRSQKYQIAVPGVLDDDGTEEVLPPGITLAVRATAAAHASCNYTVPSRYLEDARKQARLAAAAQGVTSTSTVAVSALPPGIGGPTIIGGMGTPVAHRHPAVRTPHADARAALRGRHSPLKNEDGADGYGGRARPRSPFASTWRSHRGGSPTKSSPPGRRLYA